MQRSTWLWQTFADHPLVRNWLDRPSHCASSPSEKVPAKNAHSQAAPMTITFALWFWGSLAFLSIEVQVISSIALISVVQQIDSVTYVYNTHTHTHGFFCMFFSIVVYHRILLCRKTLLFVHLMYNSLHLLTSSSHSIPPPLLALGNHKSVL